MINTEAILDTHIIKSFLLPKFSKAMYPKRSILNHFGLFLMFPFMALPFGSLIGSSSSVLIKAVRNLAKHLRVDCILAYDSYAKFKKNVERQFLTNRLITIRSGEISGSDCKYIPRMLS